LSLVDEDGSVVATTTSTRDGSYQFNGVQIGNYAVKVTTTAKVTTAASTIAVTRGQAFNGVNFGLRPTLPAMPPVHGPISADPIKIDGDQVMLTELA
jgi:hypothetical protein